MHASPPIVAVTAAILCLVRLCSAGDLPPDKAAKVDALVTAALERGHIPGAGVAIAMGNETVFQKGYGLSDVENSVPVTEKTRFRTASIAKPLTAVLAMRLVETGKFDLDAPVQKYVPEFPVKEWPLTPRHLLSHTGGVRHYGKPHESTGREYYPAIRDALRLFADDPLLFEPGTKFLYTTFGYNLLGAAAESAGGADFEKLLALHVTGPAGMGSTVIDSHERIIPHRSRGYAMKGTELRNAALHDTSMKIPGGGLLSTPGDLVQFGIALNTGKLLQPATVAAMWTRQRTKDGQEIEYGQGWRVSESDAKPRVVSHSGAQAGTSTLLTLHPASGRAIAVMFNLEKAAPGPLVQAIFEVLGAE
jgi:CubicO group peptidase (beta-lactamase class C family)